MPSKKSSNQSDKKLDALDIKIIKALLENSRKPLAEIASDCKVSTLTVNKRFNELKRRGVVRGSSVLINYAHLGAEGLGILSINVNPNKLNDFLKDMREMQGNFFFRQRKLLENTNVQMVSLVKNLRDIEKLKDSVKQHSAVVDISTNIWTYMKVNPANLKLED